jgi:hypothetical protein
VKPTANQLRVLRALLVGYALVPKSARSVAFLLQAPDGYIDGAVYSKTITQLRAGGWIDGELRLTEAGRELAKRKRRGL